VYISTATAESGWWW